jgi:hypothetical protein
MVLRDEVVRKGERLEVRRVSGHRIGDGKIAVGNIADIDIDEANQYEVDEIFA